MSDSGGPGKPLKAARPWSWRSPALVSVGKDLGAAVLAEKATSSALGATWATRMRTSTLYRVLAALLVLIAVAFLATDLGTVTYWTCHRWGGSLLASWRACSSEPSLP